jgi:hypothetical protein
MRTLTPKLAGREKWLLWVLVALVWGGALIGAVAFSHFARLNLWACLGIAVGGILVNGWVARLEDEPARQLQQSRRQAHAPVRDHHRLGGPERGRCGGPVAAPDARPVRVWLPVAGGR